MAVNTVFNRMQSDVKISEIQLCWFYHLFSKKYFPGTWGKDLIADPLPVFSYIINKRDHLSTIKDGGVSFKWPSKTHNNSTCWLCLHTILYAEVQTRKL